MPNYSSKELLQQLEADVRRGIERVQSFQDLPVDALETPPATGGWSVAHVFAHLNFYAGFYTEAIEKAMEASNRSPRERFKSGWLGNYFTRIIGPAPEDGELAQKMTSPKNADPKMIPVATAKEEITTFLQHQNRILFLLHQARNADLGRIRVPTSLSNWVQLKLGDTFRFVIAHQQRHFQQIERILEGRKTEVIQDRKSEVGSRR